MSARSVANLVFTTCWRAAFVDQDIGYGLRLSSSTLLTGAHRWADRYDRDVEDVFDLQDEVVRTIVSIQPPT